MECRCSRNALVKLIQSSLDIISDKNFLNIFSHVALQLIKDRLTVHASDSIIHTHSNISVEGLSDGNVAVHADRLSSVLRTIQDDTVQLRVENKTLIITPAYTKDQHTRFELRTLETDEITHVAKVHEAFTLSISLQNLQALIVKSIISVSNDESRFFLTGVYLTQEDGYLHMVATDGKRLSIVKDPKTSLSASYKGKIIPPKILRFIQKNAGKDGSVSLNIGEKLLSISVDNGLQLTSPHIEGEFPDYKRVIPSSQQYRLDIDRQACVDAIKRASLFVDVANKVYFHIQKKQVYIYAEDDNYGKAEEFIATDYDGEAMLFAFNYKFLLEPLLVEESDTITLHFSDPQKVVTITAKTKQTIDSFHVIMPMRVTM